MGFGYRQSCAQITYAVCVPSVKYTSAETRSEISNTLTHDPLFALQSSVQPFKPEAPEAWIHPSAQDHQCRNPPHSFPLVYLYLGVLSSINKELNTSGLAVVVESSTKELRNASRRDAELPCVWNRVPWRRRTHSILYRRYTCVVWIQSGHTTSTLLGCHTHIRPRAAVPAVVLVTSVPAVILHLLSVGWWKTSILQQLFRHLGAGLYSSSLASGLE